MQKKIYSHTDMIVWQKSIILVEKVYKLIKAFPKSEQYNLGSQMKRAVTSIPSNIAEGKKRKTRKDYRNFVIIAYGSGAELESHLQLVKNLSFINTQEYDELKCLLTEVMKMLNKLSSALK